MWRKEWLFFVVLMLLWDVSVCGQRHRCPRRRNLSVCEQSCTSQSCPLGQLCCPTKCGGMECTCPRGVPLFNCLVSPCMFATCPAFPDAQCVADYCGGCNARFFKRNHGSGTRGCEVTNRCKNNGDSDGSGGSGVPDCNINCFIFPCDERIASCPAFPQAVCRAQCGCTAKFFLTENGEERDVTNQCTAK